MSEISELLALVPVGQIAQQLGVDEQTAKQGIEAALPTLLGGLQANAASPDGARSLASALETKDPSLVDGGVSLADIDTDDGQKIVRNVFGDSTDQIAAALGSAPGNQSSGLIQKLLPILAPIVLAWLAKKFLGGQQGAPAAEGSQSGGGLEDLLGGILGGGGGGGATAGGSSSGGGLGDLLGGLLGGGKR